jgi:hypothetical protein
MENRIASLSQAAKSLNDISGFKKKATELDRIQNEYSACVAEMTRLRLMLSEQAGGAIVELTDDEYQQYVDDVAAMVEDIHEKESIEEQLELFKTIKQKLACMEQYLNNRKQKIIYI